MELLCRLSTVVGRNGTLKSRYGDGLARQLEMSDVVDDITDAGRDFVVCRLKFTGVGADVDDAGEGSDSG